MFRKIVSNLHFSPSLVGQLGFYAKKLRNEEATRRLGLVFVILALAVQSLAMFQPAESANATDEIEIITNKISDDNLSTENIIKSKTATSASRGFVDASSEKAYANDQISYTIAVENAGLEMRTIKIEDYLGDVLEYASVINNGGGILNKETKTLYWPEIALGPKSKQTRTFIVRLLNSIPATAHGKKNSTSYDCIMTNTFGNSVNVSVDCPMPKIVESIATELPKIGLIENIIFSVIVLFISSYFYLRNRQMKKEIQLIRKDICTGTIY